jgi:glycosyltransferase involved in cell wall biosynthesis
MQQSIIHLVTPAEVGGLESAVQVLAAGQHARGHDVRVIASIGTPNAAAAWINGLRTLGVPVHPIVSSGRDYLGDWRRIRRECAAHAPDVVHTHGYRADVLGGGAARAAGCRTVTTVHGFLGGDWKNRMYERLQRRAFRHFDAVVAVSRRMGNELRDQSLTNVHVVPNAFSSRHSIVAQDEARAALGLPADEFRIGWVGRLSPEKGADVMIHALANEAIADVQLSIVGDGADRKQLARLASSLGVDDRIAWHGVRYDAPALLRAFDALVLSSRTEGTPIVLLEAMAAGVPIVATTVGGVPDVVGSEHALLVPPNDPIAIASAVDAIRRDSRAAQCRTWRAAQRVARDYAVGPWIDQYEQIYESAMRARARSVA